MFLLSEREELTTQSLQVPLHDGRINIDNRHSLFENPRTKSICRAKMPANRAAGVAIAMEHRSDLSVPRNISSQFADISGTDNEKTCRQSKTSPGSCGVDQVTPPERTLWKQWAANALNLIGISFGRFHAFFSNGKSDRQRKY